MTPGIHPNTREPRQAKGNVARVITAARRDVVWGTGEKSGRTKQILIAPRAALFFVVGVVVPGPRWMRDRCLPLGGSGFVHSGDKLTLAASSPPLLPVYASLQGSVIETMFVFFLFLLLIRGFAMLPVFVRNTLAIASSTFQKKKIAVTLARREDR